MVYIYVLELKNGKYYVGKTNNPAFRLESHFNSSGSEWTKLHKPINIIDIIPNCDNYDEDKITIQNMEKYGINNVRGGSFCSINLKKPIIDTIIQMINGAENKCYLCGKRGHFAKYCKEEYDTVYVCSYCEKEYDDFDECEEHEDRCYERLKKKDSCYRCGREGHYSPSCYARTHIKGYYI